MRKAVKELLDRVANWPEEDVEKLAEAAAEIEAWRTGEYHPSEDELRAIDEGLAELDRGERATPEQVRAAFQTFRRA